MRPRPTLRVVTQLLLVGSGIFVRLHREALFGFLGRRAGGASDHLQHVLLFRRFRGRRALRPFERERRLDLRLRLLRLFADVFEARHPGLRLTELVHVLRSSAAGGDRP